MRAGLRCFATLLESKSGTAAVEFAVVVSILLALVLPVIDLGMGLHQQMELTGAAQAGAQYALSKGFDATAIQNAVTGATSLSSVTATPAPTQSCGCPSGTSIAAASPSTPPCTGVCASGARSGTYVTVNASAVYHPLVPYPLLGNSVNLTAKSIVRIQ